LRYVYVFFDNIASAATCLACPDHSWLAQITRVLFQQKCDLAQEKADTYPFNTITDPGERKALVADLHRLKTDIFMEMIEAGQMPLRNGVKRLVGTH
jgi:hypothetical protein